VEDLPLRVHVVTGHRTIQQNAVDLSLSWLVGSTVLKALKTFAWGSCCCTSLAPEVLSVEECGGTRLQALSTRAAAGAGT
jgi:hypothetical protein